MRNIYQSNCGNIEAWFVTFLYVLFLSENVLCLLNNQQGKQDGKL